VLARAAAVIGTVFGVNLMPAFGPPTWALLVLFKLNWDMHPVFLVIAGAVAAGAGRLCLAIATRRLRGHRPAKRVDSLRALGERIKQHRAGSILGLSLFAISPVPSAQLFEGAGLVEVPLLPLTASFFAGRLVGYSLYLGAATAADRSFGSAFRSSLTSPFGVALQVAMIVAVVLLARVDWSAKLKP
jgi:hypothetical protein